MSYNFRPVERDQQYLLPVSLLDWIEDDDLALVVLDAVAQMDLGPVYARYRSDGWGAPAFDPAMMTALLLYAYSTGERSSRRIERCCQRDIGYRVITANQVPDHATIARFRADHEATLRHLFTEVLRLCAAAGLGRVGLIALDGTKLAADASEDANRTADALDAEIGAMLAQAAATDAAEDERLGPDRRGDELPPELADRRTRLARLQAARSQIAADDAQRQRTYEAQLERTLETGRATRLLPPETRRRQPWRERNTTDPDSRKMKGGKGWVQGYNGQIVVAEDGLIVAAELTQEATDYRQLLPMLEATQTNLVAAGITTRPGTLLADAGYWSETNLEAVEAMPGPRVLIAPEAGRRKSSSKAPPSERRARMRRRLARPANRALYDRRGAIVEPVFGQTKEVRGVRRFRRRGFTACASEWTLICATHNLLKLWRHGCRTNPGAPPSRPPATRRPKHRT